jgi:hypothetical protein
MVIEEGVVKALNLALDFLGDLIILVTVLVLISPWILVLCHLFAAIAEWLHWRPTWAH